jgi:hypothetical protein
MPTYVFRTPVRQLDGPRLTTKPNPRTEFDDGARGSGGLLMRYVRRAGPAVAVLVEGSSVREKHSPTTAELNAATTYYLGGHDYVITEAEAETLAAAGYDITGYDTPTYGLGVYGEGVYGA